LDDGEVGEAVEGAPAASGAALLDLDWPDRPLSFIIGEDVQVRAGDEAEDHVLVPQEPAGDPAGIACGRGAPVEVRGQAGPGDGPVAAGQPGYGVLVQGLLPLGAGAAGSVPGLDEEGGHLLGPVLLPGLELVKVP